MDKDDDDFWTTWIANTPECDRRYGGGGFLVLLLAVIGVLAGLSQLFRH